MEEINKSELYKIWRERAPKICRCFDDNASCNYFGHTDNSFTRCCPEVCYVLKEMHLIKVVKTMYFLEKEK